MIESTRFHGRIRLETLPGTRLKIESGLSSPVEIFIPKRSEGRTRVMLLIHFHGAAFIPEYVVGRLKGDWVAVTVNLGSGSRVYGDAFREPGSFNRLLDAVEENLQQHFGVKHLAYRGVILSGFSAGYGAIRRILSDPVGYARVDSVLLLDGLHASYVPEGRVLADGGQINPDDLEAFVNLARECSRKESSKRFLITHSEIFPGTFTSTTEASDFILAKLGLRRQPVLAWGPNGMQQLSFVRANHFLVLGFAGNTAPDHVDHLHGLQVFVKRLLKL